MQTVKERCRRKIAPKIGDDCAKVELEEMEDVEMLKSRYDSYLGKSSKFGSVLIFSEFEKNDSLVAIETISLGKDPSVELKELLQYTRTREGLDDVCTFEWYNEITGPKHIPRTAQPNNFKVKTLTGGTSYVVLAKFMELDSTENQRVFALQHALDLTVGEKMFVTVSEDSHMLFPPHSSKNSVCQAEECYCDQLLLVSHKVDMFNPEDLSNTPSLAGEVESKMEDLKRHLDADIGFITTVERNKYEYRGDLPDVFISFIKFRDRSLDAVQRNEAIQHVAGCALKQPGGLEVEAAVKSLKQAAGEQATTLI